MADRGATDLWDHGSYKLLKIKVVITLVRAFVGGTWGKGWAFSCMLGEKPLA